MKMKEHFQNEEGVVKATPSTQLHEGSLQTQPHTVSKNINTCLEGKTFFQIASFYTKLNFKVFPVKFQGKTPLCKQGFKNASNELQTLQAWNNQFPNCNIGIPTGSINNIFVVDIDGEEGLESLAELERKYGKTEAPTVLTGKGKHLYFKFPVGVELKSSVSKIANHIDIRGEGGYVVAPPSTHENGTGYIWQDFPVETKEFPNAPQWLLDLISNPKQANSRFEQIFEEVANAPKGQRNDTLLRKTIQLAGLCCEEGLNFEPYKIELIKAAQLSGLSKEEVLKTIANAKEHITKKYCSDIVFSEEPDMSVLKSKMLLPAPTLNLKAFGEYEQWIKNTAEGTNAPVDYVAFSLLAGAAGVIGLSRTISPWEPWIEPCCLWVGAVGEPSSGKTPATSPIKKILREIELSRKAIYKERRQEWEAQKAFAEQSEELWKNSIKRDIKAGKDKNSISRPSNAICPNKPHTYRFLFADTTQEAIVRDMENNIKGAILFRDELSAWLQGMNRYNSGSAERGFWLESFNGNCFTTDRVKYDDERLEVESLLISVFGTIQPQRLTGTLKDEKGDGFLSRFIWVYPEPVRANIPQNTPDPSFVINAFKKLDTLLNPYADNAKEQKKCLKLSADARKTFEPWYLAHKDKANNEEGKVKHFLSKGEGNVLRFALLFEYLWWSCTDKEEPSEISKEAIETAINLYDNYVAPMCERVYNIYFLPTCNLEARSLARWILENKPDRFILRDVYYSGNVKHIRNKAEAEKAALVLKIHGWLIDRKERKGDSKGRQSNFYYVHPEVYNK